MARYTFRTKIEAAILTLLFTAASFYIHAGQAGESTRKSHHTTDCALCHVVVADLTSDEAPELDLSKNCLACHHLQDLDRQSGLNFHSSVKKCTECHAFHDPDQISAGLQTFRYRFDPQSSQRAICFSCHGTGESFTRISEGHKRAAALFHSDYQKFANLSPSQACLLCHSRDASADPTMTAGLALPQFDEHADHPLGVKVVPSGARAGMRIRFAVDPRIRLFDGKVECQTCHSLSASTRGRLVPFASFTELCRGCHLPD